MIPGMVEIFNRLTPQKVDYETLFLSHFFLSSLGLSYSCCSIIRDAVMLMGTLVYGIRYTFPEYMCTFLVAGGVSFFALLKVSNSAHNVCQKY